MQFSTIHCAVRGLAAGLLALVSASVAAQPVTNVFPLPQPNLDPVLGGTVDALLRLGDGSTLVGGTFSRLGARAAPGCGRLLPDGSADPGFACAFANPRGFAIDAQGRVFALRNGAPNVVRLFADGSIDASFAAVSADGTISRIAVVDGALHVGGNFTQINGTPRARLARLSLDGVLDAGWNPAPDGAVSDVIGAGDAFLYVAGSFANIGGQPRAGLARVTLADGNVDGWNPGLALAGGSVAVGSVLAQGSHLFASGSFDSVQGSARRGLARIGLDPGATLDAGWSPEVISSPFSGFSPRLLALLDGALYLGSTLPFTLRSGGAIASNRLFRVAAAGSGALDAGFVPLPEAAPANSNGPNAIVPGDGGGRLLVGGILDVFANEGLRLGLAPLNPDGSIDGGSALVEALDPGRVGQLATTPAGAVYAVGDFRRVGVAARPGLMRLTAAGTLDGAFRPAQARYTAVEFAAGAVLVANETLRQVQKLDAASGEPVAGFSPIAYSGAVNLLRATNGFVDLFGSFSVPPGPLQPRLLRIDPVDGSIAANLPLLPNAGGNVSGIEFDAASNSLFVFGNFTSLNGTPVSRLARLDAATLAIDASFAVQVSAPLSAVHADGLGGLWLSGGFATINGQPCVTPARVLLASNGGLDPAFSCVRTPVGAGALAFAAGAIYAVQASTIRRYRLADGGPADPDWLVAGLELGSYGLRARGAELLVIGQYSRLSGVQRGSIAALPLIERFFADGFE